MYRLEKTVVRLQTNEEAEQNKIFPEDTTPGERLSEAWYLTCMAHGIDPENPPAMEKSIVTVRKHEQ